jgi:hypothetical protein
VPRALERFRFNLRIPTIAQLRCVTWRPLIFDECGLEWDHNLDVSARMFPKRENNFF